MGLTLFTYLAAIFAVWASLSVRTVGASARAFRLAALSGIVYSVLLATGYVLAADYRDLALILTRVAGATAIASYLAFLRLALGYPSTRRMVVIDIVLFLAAAFCAWSMVFTDAYLMEIKRFGVDYTQFEGDYYGILSRVNSIVGLAAAAVMAIRAFFKQGRVHRQHRIVMAAGLAGSVVGGYVLSILSLDSRFMAAYPLTAISILPALLAASYAFTATRVFQARTVFRSVLLWFVVLIAFGLPLGAATGVGFLFRITAPATSLGLAAIAFLLFGRWAESFTRGRVGSGHNESSREELEAAIAHLDLSAGRDTVLGQLSALMGQAFGCSWFSALSEDESGALKQVYPDSDELVATAGSPASEALASIDRRVVFRTDIEADEAFAVWRPALSAFFDMLGAEVLVLAKEGRRVVGLFAFGPKKTGADYDDLDFGVFDAIHGKLFVVAYYVRHVARESLLETVEQEIGLADQIVKSIQERIDPIEHTGVNVSFRCESPRGLGGDLFDSVRISEHRWFFVVGDISGKGLNASMSMVILKSMIRILLKEEKDFIKLVSRANVFIKERLPRGTFFSGVFGFLALDKGSMYFINCGIPAMFFRSPDLDSIIETQGEGRMLGFVRNIEPYLKTRRLVLPPGSRVLISTDGIVEAESIRGERYGKERLARILAENKDAGAVETVDAVVRSAASFAGGKLDDDITVVAIDYTGMPKEKKR